jgi:hypothetical protein
MTTESSFDDNGWKRQRTADSGVNSLISALAPAKEPRNH